jgi:hypothetical protein
LVVSRSPGTYGKATQKFTDPNNQKTLLEVRIGSGGGGADHGDGVGRDGRGGDDAGDIIAAEVHGGAEVALSLPQFAALLNEFRSEHIQLETADEQPVVIRGAGEKLALVVRSKWNFVNSYCDEHLTSRSGAR